MGTSQFFPLEGPFLPAEAFVWDEGHEMRNLIDLLSQEYGLAEELIGWQLTEANGISDDGLVIAGGGINPAGRREAWVAILDRRPDVLVGDYNGNDLVEQADLDLVLGNWGDELLDPAAVGWLNDPPTGTVDQHELDKVLSQWGKTAAALPVSAAVPEPTTSALLFVALALISLPQRRPVLPQ